MDIYVINCEQIYAYIFFQIGLGEDVYDNFGNSLKKDATGTNAAASKK